jgi:Tfp pilus assembly protein PilV
MLLHTSPSRRGRTQSNARPGRALVELLVSTLLLSVGATASLSLLHVTSITADRVAQLADARAVTRDLAESTAANACAASSGTVAAPRLITSWSASTSASVHRLSVDVSLLAHPLAASGPRSLSAVAAGWCR